jgi:hypothetical protein
MKKNLFTHLLQASLMCCLAVLFTACDEVFGSEDNPIPAYLSMNTSDVTLKVGESKTRTAIAVSTAIVEYSSSDPAIATVDANGTVTGEAEGTATITATATGYSSASGTKMFVTESKSYKVTVETATPPTPPGLLAGKFSVSATKQVQFSQGNLRYDSSSGSWSFFDDQYQYYNGYTATYWDKFGWVGTTSVVLTSTPDKYGVDISTLNSKYGTSTTDTPNNWGETMGAGWRVLTKDEWTYLFNTRTTGGTVFGTASARYAHAEVNTDGTATKGIILFPDGVDIANSEVTTTGTVNNASAWDTKCTIGQWTALAAKGCVFLPAAGVRNSTSVVNLNLAGYYWSSSPYGSDANFAYSMYFDAGALNPANGFNRPTGCSVRLVYDVQ